MRRILLVPLLVLSAAPTAAQRHSATIEGSFVRGAAGYARQVGERVHIGVELGFGFPQLDRTLAPAQDSTGEPDFAEYLHLALFVRLPASEHLELDAGVRGSIAELWPCGASDCWPAPFVGGYVQPMVGWRQFKIGSRLTAGWIDDREPGTPDGGGSGVLSLSPLLARVTFRW